MIFNRGGGGGKMEMKFSLMVASPQKFFPAKAFLYFFIFREGFQNFKRPLEKNATWRWQSAHLESCI